MKKSQVLAALAFAFALGVAMPAMQTASVFAASNEVIFNAATTSIDGCDTEQILANVRAYGDYRKYAAIYNAYQTAKKYENSAATVYTGLMSSLKTDIEAVAKAKDPVNNAAYGYAGPVLTTSFPAATPITTTLEGLRGMRNGVTGDILAASLSAADYTKFVTLKGYMEQNANRVNVNDFAKAINAIDPQFDVAQAASLNLSGAELQNYVNGQVVRDFTAWKDANLYKKYVTLINDVDEADTILNGADELVTALENFKSWPKNQTMVSGQTNDATEVEMAAASATPISSLIAIANNNSLVKGYNNQWFLLVDYTERESNPSTTTVKAGLERSNKDIVNKLTSLFRNATKASSTNGIGVELSTLENVGSACGKPNTNNPSDGTGEDQNKPTEGDNKAPNTGALTNTEGSASTTVAMVAGIATALTAAGAGVVAYRNARRSTRK